MASQAGSPVLGKRCFDKCDPCRRKKIKCTPAERDYDRGQKCDQCEKAKLPCGHNVRIAGNRNATSVATPSISEILSPAISFSDSFNRPADRQSTAQLYQNHQPAPQNQFLSTPPSAHAGYDSSTSMSNSFQHLTPSNHGVSPLLQRALDKLPDLGEKVEVLVTLQARARAVTQMRRAFAQKMLDAELESAIGIAIQCVGAQFVTDFGEILKLTEGFNNAEVELLLRRLVSESKRLLAVPTTDNNDDILEGASERLRDVFVQAIDRLAQIYEARRDYAEADRLRLQKSVLTLDPRPRCLDEGSKEDHEAFIRTSSRVTCTFVKVLRDLSRGVKNVFLKEREQVHFPPAHLALLAGRTNVAIEMYRQGKCELFAKDILGRNVLHLAAETSDLRLLQYVVTALPTGHMPMERDRFRMTPLLIAAYVGDFDVFKCIYEHTANTRLERDVEGRNVLCVASRAGHYNIVDHLLRDKHKVFDDEKKCSPLHEAAAAGYEKIVRLLLEHKAEPRLEHDNKTAARAAEQAGHSKLARFLDDVAQQKELIEPMQYSPNTLQNLHQSIRSLLARESESPESGQSFAVARSSNVEHSIESQRMATTSSQISHTSNPHFHVSASQHLTLPQARSSPAVSQTLIQSDPESHSGFLDASYSLSGSEFDDLSWPT